MANFELANSVGKKTYNSIYFGMLQGKQIVMVLFSVTFTEESLSRMEVPFLEYWHCSGLQGLAGKQEVKIGSTKAI